MEPEHLLTVEEVCSTLRCTDRTLRNIIKRGELKAAARVKGRSLFEYWEVVRLVGTVGRQRKTREQILDKRKDRATLLNIAVER